MSNTNSNHSHLEDKKFFSRKDWLYLLLVSILFIVFFYSIFFRGHIFGFRDDGYFYTPIFKHIQDYWDRGELPLWDPCDNMGQPLAAMPTSAVFYPGKIVFFLPHFLPLDYFDCFNIYIVMHVAWCFVAVYYLLSRWRCSKAARMIGALSYTFSGPVLFQYCNIVFLIGAAWLPFVIAFADRFLRTRTTASLVGIAVSLAMMVLGGDPELAYVSALPTLGLVFLYWRSGYLDQHADNSPSNEVEKVQVPCEENEKRAQPRWRSLFHACFLIGLAAVFAGLLAAIQIIPSAALTKESDRQASSMPRSIWDIPGYMARYKKEKDANTSNISEHSLKTVSSESNGSSDAEENKDENESELDTIESSMGKTILLGLLCCNLQEDPHLNGVYQFSISPWSLPQLFWSDFGGKFFPRNSYWFSGFPNDRAWSPTLYMGIITIILALGVLRLCPRRKTEVKQRRSLHQTVRYWASWSTLIALLAGLGGFFGFWTLRALLSVFGIDLSLQFNSCDPVGGVYWLMNVFLPGFISFRYPAKIFVVCVLAVAVLAALGWDCGRKSSSVRALLQLLLIITGVALIWLYLKGMDVFCLAHVISSSFFGPYEPELAWNVTANCLLRTEIILLICYVLLFSRRFRNVLRSVQKRRKFSCANVLSWGILLLVCLDLTWANRSLISTLPQSVYRARSTYVDAIRNPHRERTPNALAPPRLYHKSGWIPNVFLETRSNKRFAERFYWENATLAPKMHLMHNINNVVSPGTMYYGSYSFFVDYFDSYIFRSDTSNLSAFVDTPYWLLPGDSDVPAPMKTTPNTEKVQKIYSTHDTTAADFASLRLPVDSSLWVLKEKTSRFKIFHDCDALDDPAVNIAFFLNEMNGKENPLPGEFARFVSYKSQRIEFEVKLTAPGDIILAEQYDKDWHATVRPVEANPSDAKPLEIKPCFGFMRRVTLPAGSFRIVMEYKPVTFYCGATLSALAWLAVFLFGAAIVIRRRK